MSIMRRVALPCGTVGGVWGVLAPIAFPVAVLLIAEEEVSSLSGMPWTVRLWLGFIILMGGLGLLATVLEYKEP
jgi:hypothetical protein